MIIFSVSELSYLFTLITENEVTNCLRRLKAEMRRNRPRVNPENLNCTAKSYYDELFGVINKSELTFSVIK